MTLEEQVLMMMEFLMSVRLVIKNLMMLASSFYVDVVVVVVVVASTSSLVLVLITNTNTNTNTNI